MVNATQRERLFSQLEQHGKRVTPQRAAVIDALLAHGGHPTPMEVRDLVWQKDASISQATVYNTIMLLAELDLIRKLDIADDENAHYDVDVRPHVNVVCSRCGRISDVHTDTLEALLGLVAARSGYQVQWGGVTMYGLCDACRRAAL
jgi:Fur family peroxide stress response transcriptional regulator